ncbi:hypothetical protein [Pelosinus sp. UFO1]|uniref:hypothetical protein n=1 Tax=Pelosinus sp. UFO1 TaxID=484770 RepID=UPI0004D0F438|nr:hypothetical protein [Pelosinus sp. UFO1]AIF52004.1 hypothetical protein UFO1_2457 [Pelosinus sp. UFO1]
MFIPTIKVTDISERWRVAIRGSAEIEAFCQEKYGKTFKLYDGYDEKSPPIADDCPYIVLLPGSKLEGAGKPENTYMATIAWCIYNKNPIVSGNDISYPGLVETDTLGQLILETVAELNPSYPVNEADYDIDPGSNFPQYPGRMNLTLNMQVTMGTKLEY